MFLYFEKPIESNVEHFARQNKEKKKKNKLRLKLKKYKETF